MNIRRVEMVTEAGDSESSSDSDESDIKEQPSKRPLLTAPHFRKVTAASKEFGQYLNAIYGGRATTRARFNEVRDDTFDS